MTVRSLATLHLPRLHVSSGVASNTSDVMAGVKAACLIVPCSLAFASLAGLPVQAGLYTAVAGMLVYAVLGTSPVLSVSLNPTIAILTADALGMTVPAGDTSAYIAAAATLALLTGIVLAVTPLLRLGLLAEFISLPTLTGFKVGLAAWIISTQIGTLLGIPFSSGTLTSNLEQVGKGIANASSDTAIFSATMLAIVLALQAFRKPPSAILVLFVLGIAAQLLFNVEASNVKLIAGVPDGLPQPEAPRLDYVRGLMPAALGIAIMTAFESISLGRTYAPVSKRPKVTRDYLALAAANVATSLFHGMPTAGGATQTRVSAESGARSKWSQVVAAALVLVSFTVFASVLNELPQAALALIICVAAAGMVRAEDVVRIGKVSSRDLILAVVAAASVVVLGPLQGVLITIGLSMLTLLYEANRPPVYELPNWNRPALLAMRMEGALHFANAERVRDRVAEALAKRPGTLRVLMLECSGIRDLEYSGMEAIVDIARDLRLFASNLWLAGLNESPKGMLRARLHIRSVPGVYCFADIRQALRFYDESNDARARAAAWQIPEDAVDLTPPRLQVA